MFYVTDHSEEIRFKLGDLNIRPREIVTQNNQQSNLDCFRNANSAGSRYLTNQSISTDIELNISSTLRSEKINILQCRKLLDLLSVEIVR